MDLDYWQEYYKGVGPAEFPSGFARFCAEKYSSEMGRLFDIGCGNGRDALFFGSRSIPCDGVEQCEVAVAKNQVKNTKLGLGVNFHKADFSVCDYDGLASGYYSIYSRFTLHAINYQEEARLFGHLKAGRNLRYVFIEARSIRDPLYGVGQNVGQHEFVTSHYRRFIDPENLKTMLEHNFSIEYFEEAFGFAKTESEDPCLIRVIAKKK